MKYDLVKIKALKKDIRAYLERYDPSYSAKQKRVKADRQLIQAIQQLKETITALGQKAGGTKVETFVADSNKIKDVLSGWATEKLTPIVNDLKKEKLIKEESGKIVGAVEKIKMEKFPDLSPKLDELKKAFQSIKPVDFPDWGEKLKNIEDAIDRIKIPEAKTSTINLNPLERGLSNLLLAIKKQKLPDNKDLVKEIKKLGTEIKKVKTGEVEFPKDIAINNFPPTKTPQPVTHININSLIGIVHSTTTTVTTTLTTLPGYGVLDNRRSVVFYNNSDDTTIYIGGSNVTSSNGLPVEAKSFSPSFDSGPRQVWYGVTSSGTADVRATELSDESSGR